MVWQDSRNGNYWDIYGAYIDPERTPTLTSDLNGDCRADFVDFALLAENWLEGFYLEDLAILASEWLECNLEPQWLCR